jgi:hypothetical protein
MKIMKLRYRSRLPDEYLKYCLHLCLSIYALPFVSYRKVCSVKHQLRNTKLNETYVPFNYSNRVYSKNVNF